MTEKERNMSFKGKTRVWKRAGASFSSEDRRR